MTFTKFLEFKSPFKRSSKISTANALKIATAKPSNPQKIITFYTTIIKNYPNTYEHEMKANFTFQMRNTFKNLHRVCLGSLPHPSPVSLKYSGGSTEGKERKREREKKKKERQQLNSITKAGEPNIDWRAVETTGCRGGYWFFIPIQRD